MMMMAATRQPRIRIHAMHTIHQCIIKSQNFRVKMVLASPLPIQVLDWMRNASIAEGFLVDHCLRIIEHVTRIGTDPEFERFVDLGIIECLFNDCHFFGVERNVEADTFDICCRIICNLIEKGMESVRTRLRECQFIVKIYSVVECGCLENRCLALMILQCMVECRYLDELTEFAGIGGISGVVELLDCAENKLLELIIAFLFVFGQVIPGGLELLVKAGASDAVDALLDKELTSDASISMCGFLSKMLSRDME
jgi:hypothetical protein